MSKLLNHLPALCNQVRRVAIEAGDITLKYFELEGTDHIEAKNDGSPVTLADQEAEAFIEKALAEIVPEVPMIGEETAAAGKLPDLKDHEYFWVVDPLDGTKEFIRGSEDFTVNIALVRGDEPVLGVVYAPAKGELYAGCGEGTAIRWLEDTGIEKSIHVRTPPAKGITVATSRHHGNNERLEKFLEGFKVEKLLRCGSSLKICAIAAGKADLYPRLGPTCEWDTAAGDAVLRAAGGSITNLEGELLRYGGSNPKWLNPEFVAAGFELAE